MKKPVFYVLLAAAFVVAALIGATSGASADQRTVTVQLADGSTVIADERYIHRRYTFLMYAGIAFGGFAALLALRTWRATRKKT